MERNGDLRCPRCCAPLGLLIHSHYGFAALAITQWYYPYWRGPVTAQCAKYRPGGRTSIAVERCRAYLETRVSLALQGVGFAVIGTFVSLYFPAKDGRWRALLLPRLAAHLSDARHVWLDAGPFWRRESGDFSLLVETVGLLLLWQAPGAWSH